MRTNDMFLIWSLLVFFYPPRVQVLSQLRRRPSDLLPRHERRRHPHQPGEPRLLEPRRTPDGKAESGGAPRGHQREFVHAGGRAHAAHGGDQASLIAGG